MNNKFVAEMSEPMHVISQNVHVLDPEKSLFIKSFDWNL